jgi:tetratricopeptide (TPR) repeat protein
MALQAHQAFEGRLAWWTVLKNLALILPALILLSAIVAVFPGCSGPGARMGQTDPTTPSQASVRNGGAEIEPPPNSYYYFTEAQLRLKRGERDGAIALLKEALALDPESIRLKHSLATLYFLGKRLDESDLLVSQVLGVQPDDVEALTLKGRIKQEQKRPLDALEAYERVLKLAPDQQNIYLVVGGLYLQEGQFEQAQRVYDDLLAHFPSAYAGHFFLGKSLAKQGRHAEAEAAFEKTLQLQPDLLEPRLELIKLYQQKKREAELSRAYAEILKRFPENIDAGFGLGLHHHHSGETEAAAELFEALGQRSIQDTNVVRKLVDLYLDKDAYADAAIILKGMQVGAPQSSDLNYLLGVALAGLDKTRDAIAAFRQVDQASRFFENAVVHTAVLYQEQGQIDAGIAFLKHILAEGEPNAEFLLYLGSFQEEKTDYAAAADTIQQGITIDPKNGRLHFRLGVVFDKWGRKADSIKSMKTAIELEPDNANALNYLGYTYADLGRELDEAERLIREALKFKPNDGYITDSLGWVYYQRGEYDKALTILKKASKLVPEDPIILEHVGDTYLKLDDRQNALRYYRKSLEKRENDTEAIQHKIEALLD